MTLRNLGATAALVLALAPTGAARASDVLTVEPVTLADEKPVFATVESTTTVAARARIGGTVIALDVREGDGVTVGRPIARIVDDKLALQLDAANADVAALEASVAQARTDLARVTSLSDRGVAAKAQLDAATTALRIAEGNLKSAQARRDVVIQQAKEGDVLAPTTGRVLTTPVTVGAVVMPGEPVATVAEGDYVLRLELPERHSRFLKVGDPVRVDPADLAKGADATGVVTLVHPLIADGRLRADAKLKGLGDYFVGQRVRVWISAGERSAFVVPADYIRTRFGVDDVELKRPDGSVVETPVQRGRATPRPDAPDDVEILSGLRAGDELVKP